MTTFSPFRAMNLMSDVRGTLVHARPARALRWLALTISALALFAAHPGSAAEFNPAWSWLGPAPIPNGQTEGVSNPVSGRVTTVVVHPTNSDIVYVGTAQGGVYRTTNGGTSWTQLFDDANKLSIGALALAPSDPTILFVGTGEPYNNGDSEYGDGLYIITDASNSATLHGPFNLDASNNDVFTGMAISSIVISATDPNTILVSTNYSYTSIGDFTTRPLAKLPRAGIYRSTNALGSSPSFSYVPVVTPALVQGFDLGTPVFDMVAASGDLNKLLCALPNGLYVSNNAMADAPAFGASFTPPAPYSLVRFGTNLTGSTLTVIAATSESQIIGKDAKGNNITRDGTVRVGTFDGTNWATWSNPIAAVNGFAGTQGNYDLAVALDPTNSNKAYLGGAAASNALIFAYFDGTQWNKSQTGLHADAHAIAVAPSSPSTIYFGCDGGIFKSTDGGQTWQSLNNSTFSATQFHTVAVHPTDRNLMIGGTQDNGTEAMDSAGNWTRIEDGDAGYCLIDQNATDTSNVTIYSTRYNLRGTLIGFFQADNVNGPYTFRGFDSGATPGSNNGISGNDNVEFYAPMALGPGTPNTLYFGTDRLYRSEDKGATMNVVSQSPIEPSASDASVGAKITAISISPQDDRVRLVGLQDGKVFFTSTGSTTLTDITGAISVSGYVSRAVIDPNDKNTAYVTIASPDLPSGQNVWKTTNLTTGATWVAAGNGIPAIPVNTLAVDPDTSSKLYAGTTDGVYFSRDGGANWRRLGSGFPHVNVWSLAMQHQNRVLRAGTHGRGVYELLPDPPKPAVSVTGPAQDSFANSFPTITGTATDYSGSGFKDGQIGLTIYNNGKYWNGSAWQDAQVTLHAVVDTNGNWSYSASGITNISGAVAISAFGIDNYGGVSQSVAGGQPGNNQVIFKYDAQPPTLSIATPLDGAVITSSALPNNWITGSAVDDQSKPTVAVYLRRTAVAGANGMTPDNSYWTGTQWYYNAQNSALPGTFTGTGSLGGNWNLAARQPAIGLSFACMTNGQYEIKVVATDLAGNSATKTTQVTVDYHPSFALTVLDPTQTPMVAADGVKVTELGRSGLLANANDSRNATPTLLRTDPAGNFYIGISLSTPYSQNSTSLTYAAIQKVNSWRMERQQNSFNVCDNATPQNCVTHYQEIWGDQTFEVPASDYSTWLALAGMQVDGQGNVYAAFHVETFQNFYSIDSSGGTHPYTALGYTSRIQVVKIDTNGHLVWKQYLGDQSSPLYYQGSNLVKDMQIAADGSVIVLSDNRYSYDDGAGRTIASGGQTILARFTPDATGGYVKFFGYGNLPTDASYNSTAEALAIDAQGNALMASLDGQEPNGFETMHLLRKVAPNGTVLKQTSQSICSGDSAWSAIATDSTGNVYVGSSFQTDNSDYRQSVLKFDSNLTQLWRSLAPPKTGSFVAGLKVSTGGVTIGGTISGGYNGTDSLMFSRFTADGQMLWARKVLDTSASQFVLDPDQNVLIRGYLWQYSNGSSTGQPGYLKIASNGDLQFRKQLAQEFNAWTNNLLLLSNGKAAVMNQDYQNKQAVIDSLDNPANVVQPAPVISGSGTAYGDFGDQFYYQVNASNNPRSYALTGTLPAGLSFDTTAGTITGTPTAKTASSGVTVKITATNRAGTSPAFSLTIIVTDSGINHTQDLQMTSITHSPQPAPAAGHLTYTIKLHNNGPDSVVSPYVTVTPDTHTTFYSVSPGYVFDNGNGTFDLAGLDEIPAAGNVTITYTVTVKSTTASGTHLNFSAVGAGNGTDTNPNNNSKSDNTATSTVAAPTPTPTPAGGADVSMQVTVSPDPAAIGNTITYHCVVKNAGPADAVGVHAYISPDNGSSDTYTSFKSSTPAVQFTDQTGFKYINLGTIAAKSSATVDVVYTAVKNGTPARLIGASAQSSDSNYGNNSQNVSSTIGYSSGGGGGGGGGTGATDVAMTMTAPSSVAVNKNVTYHCTVKNNGPNTAHTVTVYFEPDTHHETFVSATRTYTTDGTGVYIFHPGDLASGASSTFDVTCRATQTGVAQAGGAAFASESDTNSANNSASSSVNVTATGPTPTPTATPKPTASPTATPRPSATPTPTPVPKPTPQVTSPGSAHATTGVPFSYQVTASNNPTSYGAISKNGSVLPAGITVNATSGVVSGKFSSPGSFVIDVSARNAAGAGHKLVTIEVQAFDASNKDSGFVSSSGSVTGKVGEPFNFRIDVSHDVATFLSLPNVSISVTGLPAGLTYDAGTQSLVGRAVRAGTYQVLVNASIGSYHTVATLQITISADPQFPELNNPTISVAEVGKPFTYKITLSGTDPKEPVKYSYSGTLPAGLTFDPATGTISGSIQPGASIYGPNVKAASDPTQYNAPLTLYATNSHGTASQQLKLEVTPKASSTLLNLSTRMKVLSGDQVLIGGFIVIGTEPKLVAVRAIGPSLKAAGITNAISDPILELHDSKGALIVSNDSWKQSQADQITAIGIPPSNDAEATVVRLLAPGSYTAVVKGKGGATGVGLVELYDLDRGAAAKPANISTRGFVDSGNSVMIGGFIVGPGSKTAQVLLRGIGPSLATAGVTGALQDPMVELHDGNGNVVAQNDNWQDNATQASLVQATGVPPQSPLESALVTDLKPGSYTAVLRGKNNGTGVGLVEVYHLR